MRTTTGGSDIARHRTTAPRRLRAYDTPVLISAFGTLPHYRAHMAPILEALPESLRGPLVDKTEDLPDDGPVIVAGFVDLSRVKGRRPIIYVEHGAGQTYDGDAIYATRHPSYSGSTHASFNRVVLFVCPNETVADRWRVVQPDTPAVAVGCPKLDVWHRRMPPPVDLAPPSLVDASPIIAAVTGVVGWTWHWGAQINVKEATSALPYYERQLPEIVAKLRGNGIDIIGHAHPRAAGPIGRMWKNLGVPWTDDPDDLFADCDLLVADNTSLLYEFASLDRPIVALNAPWYRRRVNHGLRFWDDVPGIQINEPAELPWNIQIALGDPYSVAVARRATIARVYGPTDGNASQRAAQAIAGIVGS